MNRSHMKKTLTKLKVFSIRFFLGILVIVALSVIKVVISDYQRNHRPIISESRLIGDFGLPGQ
jgi:hypothetical protein